MKYAEDFRRIARNALSGRWGIAVIAGLLAVLLGGAVSSGPEINLNISDSGANVVLEFSGQQIYSSNYGWNDALTGVLVGGVTILLVASLIMAVAYYILGSVIRVGYARFNLELVDRQNEPEINVMFGYFHHWKTTALTNFLQGLYCFLWSLLLIIPGIIASYSYAMTGYILAQNPELSASEAIEQSKQLMSGNRFRLFCLRLSFFGWDLLCMLTLGIGELWLTPYKKAAEAAFYREISGTERIVDPVTAP